MHVFNMVESNLYMFDFVKIHTVQITCQPIFTCLSVLCNPNFRSIGIMTLPLIENMAKLCFVICDYMDMILVGLKYAMPNHEYHSNLTEILCSYGKGTV